MTQVWLLLPEFLLILSGFVICRATPLDRPVWDAAERLVYYLLFPVLLFNSILRSELQVSQTLSLAAAGLAIMLTGITLALLVGRWPGVPAL
ncbi:MAG: AEC family transporter, partial [Ideonella sp.]